MIQTDCLEAVKAIQEPFDEFELCPY
ncbi:hypothetical protein Godav_019701 [Gossypium davidsonii]|uniref:Uncharacterized protein n=2 Tax=Gossypium TaxID=3633 RepID=A0A7J8R209_GOSDV|nr:hypothetical protein [Gossypium davidsonii]MBA0642395.1 hypothetical protein [Gossypium klotzschianum]